MFLFGSMIKITRMRQAFLIIALFTLFACDTYVPSFPNGAVEGLKPVYEQEEETLISKSNSRTLIRPGKIYSYGNLLLISEVDAGIHVINNTDPKNPINLFFITIPGNSDMAVSGDYLYANTISDLIVLKLQDDGFELVNRINKFFMEPSDEIYPPFFDVYYECIDPAKGKVIGWENAILEAPECYKR